MRRNDTRSRRVTLRGAGAMILRASSRLFVAALLIPLGGWPITAPSRSAGAQPASEPRARDSGSDAKAPQTRDAPARLFAPGSGLELSPGAGPSPGLIPFVTTSYGSAKLLTLVQIRLNIPLRGARSDWQSYRGRFLAGQANSEQNIAFQADRIRMILSGHFLTEKLTYMIQGDAVQKPFLLDVKLTYHLPWIKGLSVSVGRFLPVYSLVMPRLISRLEASEYPMFITEGGYAPWRDFGIQIKYAHPIGRRGTLILYLGVFNGEVNSWTDTNDMKDFLLRVDFLGQGRLGGLWLGAYGWLGFPSCRPYDPTDPATLTAATCVPEDADDKKFDADIRVGIFLEWQRKRGRVRPHLMAEGYLRKYTPRARSGAEQWDTLGGGGWGHVGLRLGRYVEPLVRFEYLRTTNRLTSDARDFAWRLTAGSQIYLNGLHSHFKVNYIYQRFGVGYSGTPQWTDVDTRQGTPVLATDCHLFVIQAVSEF